MSKVGTSLITDLFGSSNNFDYISKKLYLSLVFKFSQEQYDECGCY